MKGHFVNKNYWLLAPLFIVALLAGCKSPPPDTATHYGAFDGLRTDIMADNLLETPGPPRELLYLNASRLFEDLTKATYYLEATYMARPDAGFLDIPAGESLSITADGKVMKFSCSGSSNLRKTEKDFVVERAYYAATKEQMQQIATAREVKVELTGRNGLIVRDFKEPNFEKFKKFVTMYAL